MNTRQPIQPPNTPAVLSLAFSPSRNRFIAGLSDGLRVFRTDNCLTTCRPLSSTESSTSMSGGFAIAEALDDRHIAFVSGGRLKEGRESVVIFWDCIFEQEVQRFEFGEPVLGLRLSGKWMVVVLRERAVVFEYQTLQTDLNTSKLDARDEGDVIEDGDEVLPKAPNKVHALHPTSDNPYAIACLRNDVLILPAQTLGQVQLIPLPSGSKRVLRAHNSTLRCMALSPTGNLLATTSEQGTLIRVFDTRTQDQIAEFRRGVEKAIIFSLAFSDGERWLACTSDKGTVHIFDVRPSSTMENPATSTTATGQKDKVPQQHRKSQSYATHRLSSGAPESLSAFSGRSSPITATTATHQGGGGGGGSIQEYYGLRPPPLPSSSPSAVPTAISTFKTSAWAPKVLKDVRSVASAPFHLGEEGLYWQGGVSHSWTTAPDGTRKRVKNAVPALPGEPMGRPPKGILAFAPPEKGEKKGDDDSGVSLYVIGGGIEARWEMFDLVPKDGDGWVLARRGFRKFLTKQFVD